MKKLIIVIFISVLVLTTATIIVGSRSFDGLVVDKPYETGLAWDETRRQKALLGLTVASVGGPYQVGRNRAVFALRNNDRIARDAVVSLRVTRPSTSALDRTYRCERRQDGKYQADIDLPQYGSWDLIVRVDHRGLQADHILRIFAERSAP